MLAILVALSAYGVSRADTGEEHAGHEDHRQQGMLVLTRGGYVLTRMHPVDVNLATAAQRERATQLLARAGGAAASLFPSLKAAQHRGYRGNPHRRYWWKWVGDHYAKVPGRPRLLHLNKPAYLHDRHILDPMRPESLVYLRQPDGWKLVAFMFRARTGPVPMPGGQITRWHLHGGCAVPSRVPHDNISVRDRRCNKGKVLHYGRTAMMHVWLGGTLEVGFSMVPPDELVPKTNGR